MTTTTLNTGLRALTADEVDLVSGAKSINFGPIHIGGGNGSFDFIIAGIGGFGINSNGADAWLQGVGVWSI